MSNHRLFLLAAQDYARARLRYARHKNDQRGIKHWANELRIMQEMLKMNKVYVYPTGENYSEPPAYMSDDYEIRQTDVCEVCEEELHVHYAEPFASCSCGTQEWYK